MIIYKGGKGRARSGKKDLLAGDIERLRVPEAHDNHDSCKNTPGTAETRPGVKASVVLAKFEPTRTGFRPSSASSSGGGERPRSHPTCIA